MTAEQTTASRRASSRRRAREINELATEISAREERLNKEAKAKHEAKLLRGDKVGMTRLGIDNLWAEKT